MYIFDGTSWFDWAYYIGLITNIHIIGYWTWRVSKDLKNIAGQSATPWTCIEQPMLTWLSLLIILISLAHTVSGIKGQISDDLIFVTCIWCYVACAVVFLGLQAFVCTNCLICYMHISCNLIWKLKSFCQEYKCNCQRKHGF